LGSLLAGFLAKLLSLYLTIATFSAVIVAMSAVIYLRLSPTEFAPLDPQARHG
jgi:hypothetical protein